MYKADGTAVEVPLNQVAQAARTGSLGFGADQKVVVSDPSAGGFVQMTGAEAANFFGSSRSYGTSAATAGDYAQQERRKELETAPQQVAAAGLGVARGLSIGLSDYAASEIGGDKVRRYLADQQKINPGLSTAGEVAGMAAALLASGGTSGALSVGGKAAKAATVLPRGIAALGEGAGAAAKTGAVALGLAEDARLTRAAGVAAQNFVEGSLYGIGQTVSDASIKDEPITTQKLLAGGAHGGLLGVALAGTLHGAVAGVGAAGKKIAGKLTGEADRLGMRAAEGETGALVRAAEGEPQGLLGKAEDYATRRAAEQIGIATEGKTAQQIQKEFADAQTLSSIAPTIQKAEKELRRFHPDVRQVAVDLLENDVRRIAGKEAREVMTREEIAQATKTLKREVGDEFEGTLKRFDDAAEARAGEAANDFHARPSMADVAQRARAEVLDPLLAESLGDGGLRKRISASVNGYLREYEKIGDVSFRDLHKMRRKLDETIKFNAESAADKVRADALRKVRDIVNDELTTKAQSALDKVGGDAALEWKLVNQKYQAAQWLEKTAETGAMRDAKNRVFGLSEQLTANRFADVGKTAAGGIGAAIGSVFGPGGAAVGAGVGGLVGGAAGSLFGSRTASLIRRYGDQEVARIAREATTDGLLRATVNRVDDRLGTSVKKFFSGAAEGAPGIATKAPKTLPLAAVAVEAGRVGARATAARDEEYKQKRQQYADLAASPMRLAAATDAVRQVRPDVATSLDKKLAEIVKYVNDKAPPGFAGATAFQPRGIDRVPPADARQFLKVAKAAENPLSVLDDLEAGRLSTASVQTVRDLYPDLYAEMQQKVMDKVADNVAAGTPLPYQKRLQLGVLLDVPTDASLTPQFLAASQASYAARPLAQEDGAGGAAGASAAPFAPKRPIKMSTSYSTRLDAMESGARE